MSVRRNYCPNPSCATTKWGTDGAGITYTRETVPPVPLPVGVVACTKMVHASGAWQSALVVPKFSVAPGDNWSVGIFVHVSAINGGDNPYLNLVTYNGAAIVRASAANVAISAVNSEFALIAVGLNIAAGEDGLSVHFQGRTATGTYYIAGCLLEKSVELGTFFDGSSLFSAWVGPANASDSINVSDDLLAAVAAVKLKTDVIPASPAAVGSAMVLTSAYDAAKTAAAPGANMVATNMVAAAPLAAANAAAVLAAEPQPPATPTRFLNQLGELTTVVPVQLSTPETAAFAGRFRAYPTGVLCRDGSLLVSYHDGIDAGESNQGDIYLVRRYAPGTPLAGTWSAPWRLYAHPTPYQAPSYTQWQAAVLAKRSDGRIFLYSRLMSLPGSGVFYVDYSDDDGVTWHGREEMTLPLGVTVLQHIGETACKFTELDDGTLLISAGNVTGGSEFNQVCLESADGITWALRGAFTDYGADVGDSSGFTESTMTRCSDGSLLAATRYDDAGGRSGNGTYLSRSTNDGVTWSTPAFLAISSGSPVIRTLSDGTLLLTHRQILANYQCYVGLTCSTDDGATWSRPIPLYPQGRQAGYCDIVEDSVGVVHLLFYATDSATNQWTTGIYDQQLGDWVTNADAKLNDVLLKTNTIGALAVTVTSPVAASGTITVEQGDSYKAGRSRAIDVNVDDPTHAKGLDAVNTTLYLLATQFTWTAASVTETVPGYLVRFEPTIAETAAVLRGQSYKLKAAIDNVAPTDDEAETIQRGRVVLNRDIPAVAAP